VNTSGSGTAGTSTNPLLVLPVKVENLIIA
jgi:hypothetical protein